MNNNMAKANQRGNKLVARRSIQPVAFFRVPCTILNLKS